MPPCRKTAEIRASQRVKICSYPVAEERGKELAKGLEDLEKGPYVAETFPVHVEDSYVVIIIET